MSRIDGFNPYEAPKVELGNLANNPVSRTRRFIGIFLGLSSSLLLARAFWLAQFWSTMYEGARNRTVVLPGFFTILALFGAWLAFRSRVAILAIIPVTLAWALGIACYHYFIQN